MKRKVMIEVIASLLVLLFLYTCGSKWVDFTLYIDDMNNQPLPHQLTPWLVSRSEFDRLRFTNAKIHTTVS